MLFLSILVVHFTKWCGIIDFEEEKKTNELYSAFLWNNNRTLIRFSWCDHRISQNFQLYLNDNGKKEEKNAWENECTSVFIENHFNSLLLSIHPLQCLQWCSRAMRTENMDTEFRKIRIHLISVPIEMDSVFMVYITCPTKWLSEKKAKEYFSGFFDLESSFTELECINSWKVASTDKSTFY